MRLIALLHRVSRLCAGFMGAGYLIVALFTTADVLMRKWFNSPLIGVEEIAGYVFAVSTVWGFAYCLFERVHVRIDAAYQLLPVAARAWLDVLALLALLSFVAMLSWRAWGTLAETLAYDSTSLTSLQTPMWIPQSLWVGGFLFLLISNVVLLLAAVAALLRGRYDQVQQLAGIPSATDEAFESARLAEGEK
ncbi:MAG: TRAP transporter small permease [Burkholderiaceae bacterium]